MVNNDFINRDLIVNDIKHLSRVTNGICLSGLSILLQPTEDPIIVTEAATAKTMLRLYLPCLNTPQKNFLIAFTTENTLVCCIPLSHRFSAEGGPQAALGRPLRVQGAECRPYLSSSLM